MPCQDTLYWNRIGADPAFARANSTLDSGRWAASKAEAEVCRVGKILADGGEVGEILIPPCPNPPADHFEDEWGDRIRGMAAAEVECARVAIGFLTQLKEGEVSAALRAWLARHWRQDLNRLERDNERHKREIRTPQYASGPKHQKRLARIAEDTPEIEALKRRIAWADS